MLLPDLSFPCKSCALFITAAIYCVCCCCFYGVDCPLSFISFIRGKDLLCFRCVLCVLPQQSSLSRKRERNELAPRHLAAERNALAPRRLTVERLCIYPFLAPVHRPFYAMEEQKLNIDKLKYMELLEKVRETLEGEKSPKYLIPILLPSPEIKPEGTRLEDSKLKDMKGKEKVKEKEMKTKLKDKGNWRNRVRVQEQAYEKWTMDLPIVSDDGHRVSFRFDRRDLYLLGYQKTDGAYYQFKDSRLQDLRGVDLDFGSSYASLADASKCPHNKLTLGFYDFNDAIKLLASKTAVPKEDQREIAWSLFVTAQMVSEASRFKVIAQEVAGNDVRWCSNKKLPSYLIEMQKEWLDISVYLQRPDILAKHPFHKRPPHLAIVELGINTLESLAEAMGVLKKRKEDKKEKSYSPCSCCSDTEKD